MPVNFNPMLNLEARAQGDIKFEPPPESVFMIQDCSRWPCTPCFNGEADDGDASAGPGVRYVAWEGGSGVRQTYVETVTLPVAEGCDVGFGLIWLGVHGA